MFIPDLTAIPLGYTENNRPWCEQLYGTHWLIAGSTGAGKASVNWSLLYGLAPGIRTGGVRVHGIDPKGGMEFSKAPAVFSSLVRESGVEAVELIEWVAELTVWRSKYFSEHPTETEWHPGCGMPFEILCIDELADVLAYQRDRKLRERANLALQSICSKGRAPGVAVVGQIQDPRKEILSFRHLFPTRIAMRLDEPAQVDMVLGDGVRQRGAFAHEIPASLPGIAWVKVDGRREPERVRAYHVTDDHLAYLNGYVAGGHFPIEVA